MDTKRIIADLRAERNRIDHAIAALESLDGTGGRRGRPAGSTSAPAGRRRKMSPEGRARISAAQRARWAKLKGGSKPRAKTTTKNKRGGISAAGRRRLSEMMKKRWAERRKQQKSSRAA